MAGPRGAVLVTAATVLVLTGCDGETSSAPITTTDQAGRTTVITPAPDDAEATGGAGPDDAAVSSVPPVPWTTTTLSAPEGQAVLVEHPQGWSVDDLGPLPLTGVAQGSVPPQVWCLDPPMQTPAIDGCSGVVVAIGPDGLPGAEGLPYAVRQAGGWVSTEDEVPCPFADRDDEADVEGAEPNVLRADADGQPLTTTSTEVGPHRATYETWRVRCTGSEEVLTPQVWQLSDLDVLVKDYYGHPETTRIVESVRAEDAR